MGRITERILQELVVSPLVVARLLHTCDMVAFAKQQRSAGLYTPERCVTLPELGCRHYVCSVFRGYHSPR